MSNDQCVHLMIYVAVFLLFPPHSQKLLMKLVRFSNQGNIAYIINRAKIAFHGGYNKGASRYGVGLEDGEIFQYLFYHA